jgi:hypothetical protein
LCFSSYVAAGSVEPVARLPAVAYLCFSSYVAAGSVEPVARLSAVAYLCFSSYVAAGSVALLTSLAYGSAAGCAARLCLAVR